MLDERDFVQLILDKLDRVESHLGSIDVTMVRNTVSLEEHVKRTNLLEQNIDDLKGEFKPVKDHVDFVRHSSKFVAIVISSLGAIIAAIATIWKMLA